MTYGALPCRILADVDPCRIDDHALNQALILWRACVAGTPGAPNDLDRLLRVFADNLLTVESGAGGLTVATVGNTLGPALMAVDGAPFDTDHGSPIARAVAPLADTAMAKAVPVHAMLRRVDDPRSEHWECLILPSLPAAGRAGDGAGDGAVQGGGDAPGPTGATVLLLARGMLWELLEHLANTSDAGIVLATRPTPDGEPVAQFINQQASRLLGQPIDDLRWQPLPAMLPKEWWQALATPVANAIDHHAAGEREFAAPGVGSGWLQAIVTGIPQGCVLELRRLDAAATDGGRSLIDVLSSLPIPMTVVDPETAAVTFYNKAAEMKFGLPPVGMTAYLSTDFYVDPRDRDRTVAILRRDGYLDHHQVRMRDAKGRPFWALLMSRLIVQDGRSVAVTAVLDIEARHVMESELRRLATTDQLTGVANRTTFLAALDRELARVSRTGRPLALAMIDLDHFKAVNDTYGHAVGDDVLRGAVNRLRPHLRNMDVFGRLGGEEFGLLLPECTVDGATTLTERLRAALADDPVFTLVDGTAITITASFGITGYIGAGDNAQGMLRRADMALYAAKDAGRNAVRSDSGGDA